MKVEAMGGHDDMKTETAGNDAASELGADVGKTVDQANSGGKEGADAFNKLVKMLLEALKPEGEEGQDPAGGGNQDAGGAKPSGAAEGKGQAGDTMEMLKKLIKALVEEEGLDSKQGEKLEQTVNGRLQETADA